MVSANEIDALYEATLAPRLTALESLRLDVRGYLIRAGLLVGVPAVLLLANDLVALALPEGFGWLAMAVPLVGVVAAVLVAITRYLLPASAASANYRSRFKHEVAAEVFKIVCPTAAYAPFEGIAKEVVDEPGLFNARGEHTSDDRVRGVIGQTPFEAADVSRSYATGGKNSTTVVVFRGLFFHLDFNKQLKATTLVDPSGARSSTIGDRSALIAVALENPVFNERFRVWTSDEVEARYILTPSMMERILALSALTQKPVHLAFKNNRAFLGVNYGRALFEPGIRDSTSAAAVHEMAAQFSLAEGIVEELDLNTRIWTKGVDELHHAPDAAQPLAALDQAAREGTLSPEAIWAAGLQALSETHAAADAGAVRPTSTSITIDRSGEVLTVRYGRTLRVVIQFGLWGVTLAVALAAARLLPVHLRRPELAPLVGWIPPIPYASTLVPSEPLVWFLVSLVLSLVFLVLWALAVRRVDIAPDAVRVWRGLRPLPRVYPRPPYGMITQSNDTLYVCKTDALSLFQASLSTMLPKEEAAWVAAEMRRAMRDTAR